jgi:hypothetical protein
VVQRLYNGDRVGIDSGEHAGKHGVVIPRLSINFTHSRRGSIPQIEGATSPLGIHDILVRLDNGKTVAIPKNQLSKVDGGEYPLLVGVLDGAGNA